MHKEKPPGGVSNTFLGGFLVSGGFGGSLGQSGMFVGTPHGWVLGSPSVELLSCPRGEGAGQWAVLPPLPTHLENPPRRVRSDSHPDPPPPGRSKEEDHIWPKPGAKGGGIFFGHTVGGGGVTSPSVCMLKMLRIYWGMHDAYQEKKFYP